VITASSQKPVFVLTVMFAQDGSGNLQVSTRTQQLTGMSIKLALMIEVDLGQAYVYSQGRVLLESSLKRGAGISFSREVTGDSRDVESPGPW
jgi:hypothetical protein